MTRNPWIRWPGLDAVDMLDILPRADDLVQVKYRDLPGYTPRVHRAGNLRWTLTGEIDENGQRDIIAFRKVDE